MNLDKSFKTVKKSGSYLCLYIGLNKSAKDLGLKNTNVDWLNFYQIMLDSNDPLSFYPLKLKGHFTPEGYKILAKEIQNFLQ